MSDITPTPPPPGGSSDPARYPDPPAAHGPSLRAALKARLRGWWDRNHAVLVPALASLLAALLGSVLTWLGVPPEKVERVERVIVEVPVPVLDELDGMGMGWVNDPEAVQAVADTFPAVRFAATPAGRVAEGDLPRFVYLWHAERKLTGRPTPLKDQNPTGSCVGFGTTTAIERTLAAEIAARGGDPSEFTHFSEEVTYAGSRVEVNGGRVPFRGDGSTGGWAAKFVTAWGMVPRAVHGRHDLRAYDAARARAWGASGVPDDLEPTARQFPVKDATRVRSWGEAKRALASGYGIQVASSQGFARVRDARGVAAPRGRWAHSMCLDGYHTDSDGREYGHVENSWSDLPDASGRRTGQSYHTGPTGWGDPTTAGFWADAQVIDRMLREGDSWAYSGAVGFPARKLDWFIRAEPAGLANRAQDRLRVGPKELFALAP